jgi:hypothetical protein
MDYGVEDNLLPIDSEALVSTTMLLDAMGRAKSLMLGIADTPEKLLIRIGVTYYDFVSMLLSYPLKPLASSGRLPLSAARRHALTIANLLTVLSIEPSTHYSPQNGGTGHQQELRLRWIKAITEVSLQEEEPAWEPTVASYIQATTIMLGASTKKLLEEPHISLDPEEVPGRIPSSDPAAFTSDGAGIVLVRCAATTLCMDALVALDFSDGE